MRWAWARWHGSWYVTCIDAAPKAAGSRSDARNSVMSCTLAVSWAARARVLAALALKELLVLLHGRAAARRGHHDRLHVRVQEGPHVLAGHLPGPRLFPGVHVQGAAAALVPAARRPRSRSPRGPAQPLPLWTPGRGASRTPPGAPRAAASLPSRRSRPVPWRQRIARAPEAVPPPPSEAPASAGGALSCAPATVTPSAGTGRRRRPARLFSRIPVKGAARRRQGGAAAAPTADAAYASPSTRGSSR